MVIKIETAKEAKPDDRVQQVMDHRTEKKRTRSPDGAPKKLLSLRIDADVIEHFKSTGEGWQVRMNAALRKAAGL
jgi:uncharacterized protein (DUF4415 family)